jgi:hypothetical protein
MEFNDTLISAMDSMGTIATIIGIICFAIGLGVGLMEERLTPIIFGVVVCLSAANAQYVMKAVAGIEESPEQVQMLSDAKDTEKGDDAKAASDGLIKVLPWLCTLPIVFSLYKYVSAQVEAEYEIERDQNQSPSPPEEVVLPDTQPEPELHTIPKTVGSLKSTRKIQLD